MKRISRLSLLFFCLCFMSIFYSNPAAVFAQATYAIEDAVMAEKGAEEDLVSLDFKDADLKDVMKVFSQQSGLNFITSKNIETRKITLYMEDVLVEDALNALLLANNLGLQQSPKSNIIIVKAKPTLPVETITRIYKLRYFHDTTAPGQHLMGGGGGGGGGSGGLLVESFIKPLLSKYGVFVSYANLILITDVPDRFKLIDQVISEIDKPIPEVMIEVELIETTTDFLEKLGVKFSEQFAKYYGPSHSTYIPYNLFTSRAMPGTDLTGSGSISSGELSWVLEMLNTDTDTKFLSKPRILVQNREWAELKIVADQVVSVKSTTTYSESGPTITVEAERMEVGTVLRLLPIINEQEGYVSILLEPSVSRPKKSILVGPGGEEFIDPQTRSLRTVIMVGDGETVAIGGFITTEDETIKTKVPWLGDIPFFGMMFRHKEIKRIDKELLIFITPRIVMPTDKVKMWIEGGADAPQQEAPTVKPQVQAKPKAEKVQPQKSESVPLPVSRKIKLPFREQEDLRMDLTLKAAGAGVVDLVK